VTMIRLFISFLIILIFHSFSFAQTEKAISIETKNTTIVFTVNQSGKLQQEYLGGKNDKHPASPDLPNLKDAYPTYSNEYLFEPACRITHWDGNRSLDLHYSGHQIEKIDDNTTVTHIFLKDPQYPVTVTLNFKTFYNQDVIEQWMVIRHQEIGPVTLYNYASSALSFTAEKYWLTQFHGDWTNEMQMQEGELTSGIKMIDSKLGTRAHMYQTPVFILSLNSPSDENKGELIAGTMAWSGSFQLLFEIEPDKRLRMISGINPFASEYQLEPDHDFVTPSFIFTHSKTGRGQASRNLHQWARKYGILDGTKPRLTLLNNWESTFFDFDEKSLSELFKGAGSLGVDMFLLDDGWFANKYPRNDDHAGLGDWSENISKLPHGIGYLIKEAEKNNIKFGIWLEPEMVNPKSELYEAHPDWVLKFPNREEKYFRNQLVLDLTNPEVQDFVYGIVDNLMTKNPDLAFIKWDCNSMIVNPHSPYLKARQSNLYIDYVQGLYSVLDRLRKKYPHLPIMLCSGGGGRVDYGALRYFTEFWPSDNTDALKRVYIQWGYSYFYPSIALCNHVTSMGKQSLKFRTDVAMSGKLGYDIRVEEMSGDELKFSREAIKNYKRLSDVVWHGDLYRLVSPYSENRAVMMYINEEKTKAVLFAYNLNQIEINNPVLLQGLSPEKKYRVKEINIFPGMEGLCPQSGILLSGDNLMKKGLAINSAQALTSAVIEITAE
jgi:alpha-galactosidase